MKTAAIEDMVLYEDKDLLVCHKPAGMPVQSRRIGSPDMENALLTYLSKKGEPLYLAVIHRLDQPVEGILVFGKNKKAAARLSSQMQAGNMEKYYLAVVCGIPERKSGRLENWMIKEKTGNKSRIAEEKEAGSKKAILEYKVLKEEANRTLMEIHLFTGRHHQIRVQMAHAGYPLWGDTKYNPELLQEKEWKQIALCAYKLSFVHPGTGKRMEFEIKPSGGNFPIV
ncbi:MAG: RluA family pseudouridine synthase [Blautia sp.]